MQRLRRLRLASPKGLRDPENVTMVFVLNLSFSSLRNALVEATGKNYQQEIKVTSNTFIALTLDFSQRPISANLKVLRLVRAGRTHPEGWRCPQLLPSQFVVWTCHLQGVTSTAEICRVSWQIVGLFFYLCLFWTFQFLRSTANLALQLPWKCPHCVCREARTSEGQRCPAFGRNCFPCSSLNEVISCRAPLRCGPVLFKLFKVAARSYQRIISIMKRRLMFSKGKTVSKIVKDISPFAAAVSIQVPFKVVICKAPFRLWKFANFLGKSRVSPFTRVGFKIFGHRRPLRSIWKDDCLETVAMPFAEKCAHQGGQRCPVFWKCFSPSSLCEVVSCRVFFGCAEFPLQISPAWKFQSLQFSSVSENQTLRRRWSLSRGCSWPRGVPVFCSRGMFGLLGVFSFKGMLPSKFHSKLPFARHHFDCGNLQTFLANLASLLLPALALRCSGIEDHCGQFEKTIALKLLPCHLQGNVPIKKVRDVPCSGSVSLPVHCVKLSVAGSFLDVQNFHCRSHRPGSFKVFSFLRSQRTKPWDDDGR